MANFIVSTVQLDPIYSLFPGESGIVTRTGGLFSTTIGDLIRQKEDVLGGVTLTVEGSIIASVRAIRAYNMELTITETGSIVAQYGGGNVNPAVIAFAPFVVEGYPAGFSIFNNSGSVVGYNHGVGFYGGATGNIFNSGTITANNAALVFDVSFYGSEKTGSTLISNSGLLSGGNFGIFMKNIADNASIRILNSGEIAGSETNAAIYVYTVGVFGTQTTLNNDGLIQGAVSLVGAATYSIVNFGDILGGVALSEGGGTFDNRNGLVSKAIAGGSGTDIILGGTGAETITGGDNADVVWGGGGDDILAGDTGDDELRGDDGADSLSGGNGNDTLSGGSGIDRLDGGTDNDTLYFDAGDLRFGLVNGGTGYDMGLNTDDTTPLSINLTATSLEAFFGSAADEVIIAGTLGGFGAFVRAGGGNDLFDGSAQADNVDGGNGVDVLYGRGGADILAGGLGGDWLQGGAGADVFDYNAGTDSTVNGQDFISDFSTADGDKINLDDALTNLGFATATFNTGFGTNASVYVFAQGGASLVQVYTGATLQMQLVVSQASLAASDFVL